MKIKLSTLTTLVLLFATQAFAQQANSNTAQQMKPAAKPPQQMQQALPAKPAQKMQASQAQKQSPEQIAQQKKLASTALRKSISRAQPKEPLKFPVVANEARVKDLPVLLKGLQTQLAQPFKAPVKVYKMAGKKMVQVDVLSVDYQPKSQTPFNVSSQSKRVEAKLQPAFLDLFGKFFSNAAIFNSFADVYPVKMVKSKDDQTLNKISREFLIRPKMGKGVPLAYAYLGKDGKLAMFKLYTRTHGWLVYDIAGIVNSQIKM